MAGRRQTAKTVKNGLKATPMRDVLCHDESSWARFGQGGTWNAGLRQLLTQFQVCSSLFKSVQGVSRTGGCGENVKT
jgi:hypothetical protein